MNLRHALLWLAVASACMACGDDETVVGTFVVPTEIAVDPLDFRGDVGCSIHEGAMRSYVMTLFTYDDRDDASPFQIGSTIPTSCALVAGFRDVIRSGSLYTAEVDAYDVPVEQLRPFGNNSSGARQMHDVDTGEIVPPRWTTHCGRTAQTAVVARSNRRVLAQPCDPLEDNNPSDTQLSIPPTLLLGQAPCTSAPSYDVTFERGGLPPSVGIPCDSEGALYNAVARTTYEIYATALAFDGKLYGTTCLARGRNGEKVVPTCNLPSDKGNVRLDVAGLMDAADNPVCPAGAFYDVFDGDGLAFNVVPIACGDEAQMGPFDSGITLFDVLVFDAEGMALGQGASCAADVAPGKSVVASCIP